jgi:hypothetical protein
MVIACALYSLRESGLPVYENQSIEGFIYYLYKPENREKETVQVYSSLQNIQEIFKDADPRISLSDEIKRPT